MTKIRLASLLVVPFISAITAVTACDNKVELPTIHLEENVDSLSENEHRGAYFIAPVEDQASDGERTFTAQAAAGSRRTIFLNRNGGTYKPGFNDSSRNISSVPTNTSTIPPYEGSDADWKELLACVKSQFAPFNVEVTDVDPGTVAHVESVMGGNASDLGLPPGVGGVAPFAGDCSVIERAVVYTFTRAYSRPRDECETAAQEIAHAFGLDHEFECTDPMTYLHGCGDKKFQETDAQCGEFAPRECSCGGARQNSVRLMTNRLGPAPTTPPPPPPPPTPTNPAPVVTIVSPANNATLPGNGNVQIVATAKDDVSVRKVELLWQFNGATTTIDCAAAPSPTTCVRAGDQFTFTLPVGTGKRSFTVRATDDQGAVTTSPAISLTLETPTSTQPTPASSVLLAPTAGSTLKIGQAFQVRAKASGDVSQVWLFWSTESGASRTFELANLDGGTTFGLNFTLSSTSSVGTRTLRLVTFDRSGQRTSSPDVKIQVQP